MTTPLTFTFGDRLRKARQHVGITQDELQRRMNEYGLRMHRSAIADLEHDRRKLSLNELAGLCKVLGVSPEFFMPPLKKSPVATWTQAEHKVAESLGVDTEMVAMLSRVLWKRSFHDERERRLTKTYGEISNQRSRQALRGHITREMRAELEKAIIDGT